MDIGGDERALWMRQRVCLTLDISTTTFDDHFKAAAPAQLLRRFCSKTQIPGSILIFSVNKWAEEVQIEEEVVVEADEEPVVETDGETSAVPSDEKVATDPAATDPTAAAGTDAEQPQEPVAPLTKKITRIEIVQRETLLLGVDKQSPEFTEKLSVYFVRSLEGDVPKRGAMSDNKYSTLMLDHFDFLVISGEMLYSMANTMSKVYLPVMEKGHSASEYSGLPDLDDGLKHELTSNINKFEQQLRLTTSTRGDVKLLIPNITANLSNPDTVIEDYEVVSQLEAAIEDWTASVAAAVDYENQKPTKHASPLSEIEYWRDRSTSLSAIYEQLTTPKVRQMLEVLRVMDNVHLRKYHENFSALSKVYLEAKDNVKFLSTLERHFKHIEKGTFNTILDNMPSLLNGLRMVRLSTASCKLTCSHVCIGVGDFPSLQYG